MSVPELPSTEWRVTCEHVEASWLSWTINVYVRSIPSSGDPGPWRKVKTCVYTCPKGQVRNTYWKDLIRAAAS